MKKLISLLLMDLMGIQLKSNTKGFFGTPSFKELAYANEQRKTKQSTTS
jgi:hypothetical protein